MNKLHKIKSQMRYSLSFDYTSLNQQLLWQESCVRLAKGNQGEKLVKTV